MSQQKVIFALCLVSGLVALAQSQNGTMDFAACGRKAQQYMGDYNKALQSATEELMNRLQSSGQEVVDMSPFQSDIDSLMNEVSSLSDFSQGLSAQRYINGWSKIISYQSSLMMKSIRTGALTGAYGAWSTYSSRIISANSNFLTKVATDCVPSMGGSN